MRVPVGQGVAGRIAASRQPLIAEDVRSLEPVNPLLRERMASLLGVPLLVEGRLIGVLHVDSATPRRFTEDDLHLIQLVADRAALALDRARLYREALAARDRAERAVRQVQAERDRLQQVLDALPEGVTILDAQGTILMVNQAGRDLAGLDARGESLLRGGLSTGYGVRRLDGTPYAAADLPLVRALRSGVPTLGEPLLVRHAVTGRDVALLSNTAPLRDAADAIIGAVGVYQDVTALHELEQARAAFLSSAAHDLKNPLTGIRGAAQVAQRRLARLATSEAAPVQAQLARILEGADTMVALINELMDAAHQRARRSTCTPRGPTWWR